MDLEGLDIGGDSSAIDEAFANAFRRSEEGDTGEQGGEATPAAPAAVEPGQRDDQGRFLAPTPEIDPVEEEEIAAEPAAQDDVAEFLAKYNNDPDVALRAAVELQKLQGRQSNEVGELRAQLQELQARVNQPQPQPQPQTPITAELVESLDQEALANPKAALGRVAQIGDPTGQLAERVMDIWFSVNPREASAFQAQAIAYQNEQRIRAEYEPLVQTHAKSAEDEAFVQGWDLARAQIATAAKVDINDEAIAGKMSEILQGSNALASAVLNAETPQARAELLVGVFDIARARGATGTDPEVARIAQAQAAAEDVAAKRAARVAKPSAVGAVPGTGASGEQTEEDRIKAGILGASSTDILSGLTTE
jgi:hypothetical protein